MIGFDFDGACAVVTGGASGICRSVVREFAGCVAKVVVANSSGSPATVADAGDNALSFAVDVAEYDQVTGLEGPAYAAFGRVDALGTAGASAEITYVQRRGMELSYKKLKGIASPSRPPKNIYGSAPSCCCLATAAVDPSSR